ncbi:MAG: hypothetical protein KA109_08970 [Saprospiraceae bacterium]|nr:hypothetical protein [Saprospiraceae bacterium]MBP8094588.1 hypothetical protein [Saprospiraceae bacterium]
MFWKTCLDHSLEILTALLGAGILGYLWSRWFGSNHKNRNEEYESQILSLRNRINQQDIDLKKSSGQYDVWAAEKSGFESQINDLTHKLEQSHSIYASYVTPDEHQSLQTRFDRDLRAASLKYDQLLAEKENLMHAVKSMEGQLLEAKGLENSLAEAKAKVTALEAQIADHSLMISATELSGSHLQDQLNHALADVAQKESSMSNLRNQLNSIIEEKDAQLQALNLHLHQLESNASQTNNQDDTLKAKENEIIDLHQKLEDTTAALVKSENHYKDLLALKENEWNRSMQSMEAEVNAKQADLEKVQHQLAQTLDASQSGQLKINELQSIIHQLEQNLGSHRAESEGLRAKMADQEKITASLQDSERKLKEWEGRWKEASTEAEQFKVAHGEMARERDQLRQLLSARESDIINAKNQLEALSGSQESQSAEYGALEQKYHDVLNDLHSSKEQVSTLQNRVNELSGYIQTLEENSKEANHQLEEKVRALNEVSSRSGEIESQLAEANEKLEQSQSSNHSFENKLTEVTHLLNEKQKQLNESHDEVMRLRGLLSESSSHLEAHQHALAEWEKRYHEEQSRLHQTQEKYAMLIDDHKAAADSLAGLEALKSELQAKVMHLSEDLHSSNEQIIKSNADLVQAESKSSALSAELHDAKIKLTQWQQANSDLEDKLKKSESESSNAESAQEDLQAKLTDLQLNLTAAVQANSVISANIKKNEEFQTKYNAEVKAWQKRLSDLEKEIVQRESKLTTRYNDETKKLNSQMQSLQTELTNAKNVQKTVAVTTPPVEKKRIVEKVQQPAREIKVVTQTKTLDLKSGASILGKKFKIDDHKVVEGIGPKIEVLLRKNKITSWIQLSNTPIRELKVILDKGGSAFSLAEPTSWPAQAKLASLGEWAALKKLQDKLYAGRAKKAAKKVVVSAKTSLKVTPGTSLKKKPKPIIAKPPKAIKTKATIVPKPKIVKPLDMTKAQAVLGFTIKLNDLKLVEGIGPKIEGLLHKAGIRTWLQLSSTKTKTIQEILDKAGNRYSLADPKTWPIQSTLLAKGQWTRLKTMQEKLKGGRKI